MRLSFVIPTRNQAGFIRRCIDGCLAQTIADSEIVVRDGASTDDTVEVLRSYGDRLRFTSERDGGQSDAINKGIAEARGDIIAWINSDDFYAHDRVLSRVLREFEEPEVDIVYGLGDMVDVEGRRLRGYPTEDRPSVRDMIVRPASFVLQPTVFFKKALFTAVGGLDLALHYSMDYDLWIRMFERARRVAFVPEVFACATSHPNAKSIRAMPAQIVEAARVKARHARRIGLGPVDQAKMAAGVASMFAYYGAVRLGLKRAT